MPVYMGSSSYSVVLSDLKCHLWARFVADHADVHLNDSYCIQVHVLRITPSDVIVVYKKKVIIWHNSKFFEVLLISNTD